MPVVKATQPLAMLKYAGIAVLMLVLILSACGSEETGSATPIDGPETVAVDPDETGFAERTPEDSTADNPLALEPGLYVTEGTDCRNPSETGYRLWTGRGLEGATSSDCTFEVSSLEGETYTGRQSCAGSGTPAEYTIEILEPGSFMLTEAGETMHLTLCPEGEGPAWVDERLTNN